MPSVWQGVEQVWKPNQLAVKCNSGRAKSIQRQVQAIDGDDLDEVFSTQISSMNLVDSQLVTLKLESGNFPRFQVDTGAQCNVIPLELYKKASRDFKLSQVTPARTSITAYRGATLPVVGSAILRVSW